MNQLPVFRLKSLLPLVFGTSLFVLVGCQTTQSTPSSAQLQPIAVSAFQQLSDAKQLRQDAYDGVYEVQYVPNTGTLFAASTPSFDANSAGYVYRIDGRTLRELQKIQIPRRAFALGVNTVTNTLYVGNTLDGSLTIMDANSGFVEGVIQLAEATINEKGEKEVAHTRKVIVDENNNRLFVTSPGSQGLVWIVNAATKQVTHTIETQGLWTAGAVYDAERNRLYVSQGGKDEILAINPDNAEIVQRYSTGDSTNNVGKDSKHFFVNMTIDDKGERLFAVDANSNAVYVFDAASGDVLQIVALGQVGALDIVFNSARNEFVVSTRGVSREEPNGTGSITVFDAGSYQAKQRYALPVHPNSLTLRDDGQSVYVSVKAPHGDKHNAWRKNASDSIVRIDLP